MLLESDVASVESLYQDLVDSSVHRAYIVRQEDDLVASHPEQLAPVLKSLKKSSGYAQHEAIFMGLEPSIGTVFFAFIHDTRRGLAQGGLRFKEYSSLDDIVFDGLRLSEGMTRKNALAGLWWGGGKAIIPKTNGTKKAANSEPGKGERRLLFQAFGRFVASLNGIYYTAEDFGTHTPDLDAILPVNRFVTCNSQEVGGSGNPSPHTAGGVFNALIAALRWQERDQIAQLQGRVVKVQGAGNVGKPLIEHLHSAGAKLWVSDEKLEAKAWVRALSDQIQIIEEPDDIYDVKAEIFVPCAEGACVGAENIPRLARSGVRLICGAANNILASDDDAEALDELGILFVPDFVCNRLGIVNCANEPFGYLESDIAEAVKKVGPDTLEVLEEAAEKSITPFAAANAKADEMAAMEHPIWGHRGAKLIQQLVDSSWKSWQAKPDDFTEKKGITTQA